MSLSQIDIYKNDVKIHHQKPQLQSKLPKPVGGLRGPITRTTGASLRRMKHWLYNTPTVFKTFATLTYGEYPPSDTKTVAQHRDALSERLKRKGIGVLGRIQEQDRGVLHFHLLLTEDMTQGALLDMWRSVTGDSSINQVECDPIINFDKVRSYMTKNEQMLSGSNANIRSWFQRGVEKPLPLIVAKGDKYCVVSIAEEIKKERALISGCNLYNCDVGNKNVSIYGVSDFAKRIVEQNKNEFYDVLYFSYEN